LFIRPLTCTDPQARAFWIAAVSGPRCDRAEFLNNDVPELALVDLRGRHRPGCDEPNMPWDLEARDLAAAVIEDVPCLEHGAAGQFDEDHRHFTIVIVRNTDHLGQGHLRMRA